MQQLPNAQEFASAIQAARETSPVAAKALDAVWSVLSARHWPVTLLNRAQWRIVCEDAIQQSSLNATDVYAAVLTLAEQHPLLPNLISNGIAVARGWVGSDVISNSMYGSYDDLLAVFRACATDAPGADYVNPELSDVSSLWTMVYWTLIWMGLTSKEPADLFQSAVSVTDRGKRVVVKTSDGSFSMEHPIGVSLLTKALSQEFASQSKASGHFIGIGLLTLRSNTSKFNTALKTTLPKHKALNFFDVYLSGRYACVKDTLVAARASALPRNLDELVRIGAIRGVPSAPAQRKIWFTRFLSWWDVYGDPNIQ